ncbi:extracellular solute-binding protein [Sinorhizobium meliloti]|nr:extracellular solute-binding protein [Sinorhizobium meliloti]
MISRTIFMCLTLLASTEWGHAGSIDVFAVRSFIQPHVVEEFEKEYPDIKVELRTPAADYDELTERLLRDSIAGTEPDVLFQGYNRFQLTVQRGLTAPLGNLLEQDNEWMRANYKPTVNTLCRTGDEIFGLPYSISVPVLFYNPNLVKMAGADPANFPNNWKDITFLARKITDLGGGRIGGFFDYASSGNWTFMGLVNSQGGSMMSADDKSIAFDGQEGIRALEVVEMFGKSGQVDMTREQAWQAFSAGKIGILVSASGFLKMLSEQAQFPVQVATFPMSRNGFLPAGGNCMMVLAEDAQKRADAWTFIKFMASPTIQKKGFEATGGTPGNLLGVADLTKNADPDDPRMVAIRASALAGEWYSFPGPKSLKITDTIKTFLRDVVTLKQSPADAMKGMVVAVQKLRPE